MVLGKMPPWEIVPRKIAPQKIASPHENCPPGKLLPEKSPPMKFLCEFFLIPNFYFYENFCLKMKNLLSFSSFFYYK